jgi:flagellar hook-length control protein FliK
MTLETTRAPEGAKTATTATTDAGRGKAATGRAGAAGAPGAAGGGFADVMSSLSAADTSGVVTDASQDAADDSLPTSKTGDDDKNTALALDDKGQAAINLVPTPVPVVAPALTPSAAGKGTGEKLLGVDQIDAAKSTPAAASEVTSLLNGRKAAQSHTASAGQGESREGHSQPGGHLVQQLPESAPKTLVMVSPDLTVAPAEHRESKSSSGQERTGLEGAMGATLTDRLGISPTYEVAAASAVVPDTQVAETVSYWATNGVQNAELTLDGFGKDPVEVHISVDGDQAQVDFRSNQPDVRQALEGASAQLRTMLSGEGLQLTGMSVGTSGRGNTPSEGRQPKPAPRQATVVSMEPVRATAARTSNPAVGRALDLYV